MRLRNDFEMAEELTDEQIQDIIKKSIRLALEEEAILMGISESIIETIYMNEDKAESVAEKIPPRAR
jgi:hypothetical protein